MESTTTGTSTQAAPRFELGQLCYTPGAQEVMQRYQVSPFQLIARHVTGDWGDACPKDAQTNEEALQQGSRIFSVYVLPPPMSESKTLAAAKVWIITEADRSVTTILLPEEY
ncbi:MAG TPA: type I restriction endonuclease subunit M [Methylobacter sp.]|jgi:hypothetical protein